MNYKRHRETIGPESNKRDYYAINKLCEVCKGFYLTAVHHQEFSNQRIIIEDFDNYTTLCRHCHSKLHASAKQFIREIIIAVGSKFEGWGKDKVYVYLTTLKNGETIESIRSKYPKS